MPSPWVQPPSAFSPHPFRLGLRPKTRMVNCYRNLLFTLIFSTHRLAKKKMGVNVVIYTDPKTKLTAQDVQTFNVQYPMLTVNHTTKTHNRFLIIDNTTIYHIGASLKDLGKKCFGFSILNSSYIPMILGNL